VLEVVLCFFVVNITIFQSARRQHNALLQKHWHQRIGLVDVGEGSKLI